MGAAAMRVERVGADIEVFEATSVPPQTTRAKLRGDLRSGVVAPVVHENYFIDEVLGDFATGLFECPRR